jgi:glyoxylase I family protein
MRRVIQGFSHLQLVVRDVETSIAWYGAALGMEPLVSGSIESGPYAALRHPRAGFVVGLQTATPGEQTGAGGVNHVSFAVRDLIELESMRARLRSNGIAVSELIEEAASWNVQLRDPDGLVVELSAPKRVREPRA